MNKFIVLLVFLVGCGYPPFGFPDPDWYVEVPDNDPIVEYARQKTVDYFGVEPYVEFVAEVKTHEDIQKACGYEAPEFLITCNKFGKILIRANTDEYRCQQILHEMGHSAVYALHKGWDYDHSYGNDFYFGGYISESCRVYGNW